MDRGVWGERGLGGLAWEVRQLWRLLGLAQPRMDASPMRLGTAPRMDHHLLMKAADRTTSIALPRF